MILFFIKKVFFDAWDNLITVVLFNLGFALVLGGTSYIAFLFEPAGIGFFLTVILGVFVFNIYAGGVSGYTGDLIGYKSVEFRSFPGYIKKALKTSVTISIVSIFQIAVLFIGFPFYFSVGGVPGLVGLVTIFWISVFWWISVQYFFPVSFQLEGNVKKQIKKIFLIFLDNTFFSVFLGIYSLIVLALSAFTAFLIPGVAVVLLAHQTALKLRLYKYDYLEENKDAGRKNIPWNALLFDEREKVGKRTLKGMIFPWKE